jgi:hypothetical protein
MKISPLLQKYRYKYRILHILGVFSSIRERLKSRNVSPTVFRDQTNMTFYASQ